MNRKWFYFNRDYLILLKAKSFCAVATRVFWNFTRYPTCPETVNDIYCKDNPNVVAYLNFYFSFRMNSRWTMNSTTAYLSSSIFYFSSGKLGIISVICIFFFKFTLPYNYGKIPNIAALTSLIWSCKSIDRKALSFTHASLFTLAYTSEDCDNKFFTGFISMVNANKYPSLDLPQMIRYLFIILALLVCW